MPFTEIGTHTYSASIMSLFVCIYNAMYARRWLSTQNHVVRFMQKYQFDMHE